MSKVSQVDYPAYTNSSVNIGGSSAKSKMVNNKLKSSYNMSASEAAIYNYAMNTLADILPNINTFDSNTQKSLQDSLNAYRDNGLTEIDSYYNNLLSGLRNDIVSRFGNLDNSAFANNLNSLEQNRAKAISDFAQNLLSRQNELKSNELASRYKLINLLNSLSNNIYNNALNSINVALKGSSQANAYNNNLYNANIAGANADTETMMQAIGTIAAIACML